MANVGLVACVGGKHARRAPAQDLYDSPLFSKSRKFVEQHCDGWFILSAKYGLVSPKEEIAPYEETLNSKGRGECREWSHRVWSELRKQLQPNDTVTLIAGERYRQDLVTMIRQHGCAIEVPMEGLSIGRQLEWLNQHLADAEPTSQRERDQERCYRLLERLEIGVGGKRLMSETKALPWPRRGIYIFFENGEVRAGSQTPRVVRVGTHAVSQGSRSTLWKRLATHRGSRAGTGNHRGSIFRLHAGHAIADREPQWTVPSWGVGQSAEVTTRRAEEDLERRVSAVIGAMPLLWLAIDDEPSRESDRAFIERNLIGLLSGGFAKSDAPSPAWLGNFSRHDAVSSSGLWNVDHVNYEPTSEFLDVFQEYVEVTIGRRPQPTTSIAPAGWLERDRNRPMRLRR